MRPHPVVLLPLAAIVTLLPAPAATAGIVPLDPSGYQNALNLRDLATAMHNYNDVYNHLPASSIQNAGGTPLLSWRVSLLPFLGYSSLYNAFDLTKPWNDPANLPLLDQMPDVFRSPADPAGTTATRYVVGTGPGTLFDGPTGVPIPQVTDGTSNTLLLGEAATPVPWTEPLDVPVFPGMTLGGPAGFASITPGYVPFAFADGRVGFLPDSIDSTSLLQLFLFADGSVTGGSLASDYALAPEPTALPTLLLLAAATPLSRRRRRTMK